MSAITFAGVESLKRRVVPGRVHVSDVFAQKRFGVAVRLVSFAVS
jgi:hypothetical protein